MHPLILHVITYNPRDYPGLYVVRKQEVKDGQVISHPNPMLAETLEQARGAIPRECIRIERHETDPPVVVETWL